MTIASLSIGGTTNNKSAVNCEDAVRIEKEIQNDLDYQSPVKSMKTSNKCKNLAALQKEIKITDKKVCIEKTLLFHRLIIMAERDEGIDEIFSFQLNTCSGISLHYGSYDSETAKA